MAKRPTYQVDEDYLKGIVANEVPVYPKKSPPKEEDSERVEDIGTADEAEESANEEPVPEQIEEAPKDAGKTAPRRRKDVSSYEETFLKRTRYTDKRSIYVSKEIYQKFCSFHRIISDEISMTMYMDNILAHHLECYKNDINELINRKFKQPRL